MAVFHPAMTRIDPLPVISHIANGLGVTPATPLTFAARVSALFGGVLSGLAAAYVVLFTMSGFMVTAGPRAYLTMAIIVGGLASNAVLFKRAKTLRPLSTFGLMMVSLSLSTVVVGIFAYMALDLGQP